MLGKANPPFQGCHRVQELQLWVNLGVWLYVQICAHACGIQRSTLGVVPQELSSLLLFSPKIYFTFICLCVDLSVHMCVGLSVCTCVGLSVCTCVWVCLSVCMCVGLSECVYMCGSGVCVHMWVWSVYVCRSECVCVWV